jgi:hypothetical protein
MPKPTKTEQFILDTLRRYGKPVFRETLVGSCLAGYERIQNAIEKLIDSGIIEERKGMISRKE